MNFILLIAFVSLFSDSLVSEVEPARDHHQPAKTYSQISVIGFVYCDICSNNSFSMHSYFLQGAEVQVECMFKAINPSNAEQVVFSANRTTNKDGVYKMEIPSVDGIRCAEDAGVVASCRASLIHSPSPSCNIPGYKTTADEISIKSRQANICIYSLNPLNFRPFKRYVSSCGKL